MITIHKKVVLDEYGNPTEVIIPYKEFLELEEILGLDLEDEIKEHLRQAKNERIVNKENSYLIKHEDQIPSPLWHKDILQEREKRIKNGQETILDWNEAKERIRQSIK